MRRGDAESPAPEFPRSRVKHPLPCLLLVFWALERGPWRVWTLLDSFFLFFLDEEGKMEDILART